MRKRDRPALSIGTHGKQAVFLDVPTLVVTKMLVQANSGGGKSYAMRVIAEQAMEHVQTIIIDPDGEFASLREIHDILLVGPDGDLDADVRSAGLLANRLAEKRCSAVIDLSELEIPERQAFTRDFCLSLMRIPKGKIHSMLVMIDEAQEFVPEHGMDHSESTKAVLSLMTRGRKRGIGVILCTQRISEVRKTAGDMANNRLIGRTAQDTGRKRVAADLGLERADQQALRELASGEFWAFGPAFSHKDVRKIQIGRARSSHPEPGEMLPPPPAASAKIRAILHEFADLPARAEEEASTLGDAQVEIRRLRHENERLRAAPSADPEILADLRAQLGATQAEIRHLREGHGAALADLDRARARLVSAPVPATSDPPKPRPKRPRPTNGTPVLPKGNVPAGTFKHASMESGKFRILRALAQCHPQPCTDTKIGLLANLSPKHGTYQTYMGKHRKAGYVTGDKGARRITPAGLAALGTGWEPLPTGDALRKEWLARLGGGKRRILEVLMDAFPVYLERDVLERRAGFAAGSGTFSTYLGKLRKRDLIEGRQTTRASADLFDA